MLCFRASSAPTHQRRFTGERVTSLARLSSPSVSSPSLPPWPTTSVAITCTTRTASPPHTTTWVRYLGSSLIESCTPDFCGFQLYSKVAWKLRFFAKTIGYSRFDCTTWNIRVIKSQSLGEIDHIWKSPWVVLKKYFRQHHRCRWQVPLDPKPHATTTARRRWIRLPGYRTGLDPNWWQGNLNLPPSKHNSALDIAPYLLSFGINVWWKRLVITFE